MTKHDTNYFSYSALTVLSKKFTYNRKNYFACENSCLMFSVSTVKSEKITCDDVSRVILVSLEPKVFNTKPVLQTSCIQSK